MRKVTLTDNPITGVPAHVQQYVGQRVELLGSLGSPGQPYLQVAVAQDGELLLVGVSDHFGMFPSSWNYESRHD